MDFNGYFSAVGAALLGLAPPEYSVWYSSLMMHNPGSTTVSLEMNVTTLTSGTGYNNLVSGVAGGVIVVGTGVTVSSVGKVSPGALMPGIRSAVKWYVSARMKLVYGTHAVIGICVDDGANHNVVMGFHGYYSTTHFGISDDSGSSGNGFLDLGVVADGNYHYFEMWSDASGTLFARVNGPSGTTVSRPFATGGISAVVLPSILALNEDNGADRQVYVDDFLFITPKAA